MVKPIVIPKLGLTMKKATVVKWLKSEGEAVARDKAVAVIETEKVSAELTAPEDGILLKILRPKGSTVVVGETVGFVGKIGEPVPEVTAAQPQTAAASAPAAAGATVAPTAQADVGRAKVSPRARLLAEENGLDLSKVAGTGPGGIILEKDVQEFIQRSLYTTERGLKVREVVPVSATRKAIGDNMTSSLQTMAQVTLHYEMDASELVAYREKRLPELEGKTGARVTYTDILVKVAARALRDHPMMNSTLEDAGIKVIEDVNVGVAVASDRGLIVPVVMNADKIDLAAVVTAMKDMSARGREGNLTLEEVMSGTFTITNLGMTAVDGFTPIINPPQVAILGVGRIVKKATVVADAVAVRPMVTFSLTFDHRVVDGYTAAEFLRAMVEMLQDPAKLAAAAA
ncbi:MAG: 2-oxo acid dehydrogenase subunit E2 [Nitrososphaerota archaeon]|nr:2-oxo acid dehydrogenase subunit E2 [Nitrososphaerota archaeon]